MCKFSQMSLDWLLRLGYCETQDRIPIVALLFHGQVVPRPKLHEGLTVRLRIVSGHRNHLNNHHHFLCSRSICSINIGIWYSAQSVDSGLLPSLVNVDAQGHDPNPEIGKPCQPSVALHYVAAQSNLQDQCIESEHKWYCPRKTYLFIPIVIACLS